MFSYCCKGQPDIEHVFEKDMNNLRIRIDEMKKEINNIYGLLVAMTNESKKMIKVFSRKVMFQNKRYYNLQQHQPTILATVNSSFKKLEKSMKEAPREYEQIKKLLEENDKNILNNIDLKKQILFLQKS